MSDRYKSEFFDFNKNMKQFISIVLIITAMGWYFGFDWNDIGDLFQVVGTAHKPELPIKVGYRPSFVGKGYVVLIENISDKNLSVEIYFRDINTHNKRGSFKIEAKKTITIGWLEGWDFKDGDVIKISHPDYMMGVFAIKGISIIK